MSPEHAERLVERYLDHVVEHAPVEATRLGLHERDGELPDLAPSSLDARVRDLTALASTVEESLDQLGDDVEGDEREARDDLRLLADELEFRLFVLDRRPRYSLDPLAALETVTAGVHELLRHSDLVHEIALARLESAIQRARRVPVLLEQAGSLLVSAPAPHLELALQRVPAAIALVRDVLPARAEWLGVDVSPARDAGEVAAEALEAYAALLTELAEEPAGEWRMGPADHASMLRTAVGTRLRPQDIHARARAWRDEVRAELAELATATWARRFPGQRLPESRTERIGRTLDAIADTAVDADELVDETRRAVHEAHAFARSADFVDVPPVDRLRIEPVPPHLRGIAVAFVTPPPPLDPEMGCTYYVSPLPPSWGPELRRSFLREYSPPQLRSLAIHETYPGHVVQLEHASRHPRLARRLLTRPVFAEGWAVYIEREVVRAGFGRDGTADVDADDYRITQRKLELRIATNAMLDVGLHSGDLDDPGALELLTAGAFQSRDEARGKLSRAKVAAGQMSSYFVGGEELSDLRRMIQTREGRDFDVRGFHQRLLSHGTPTVDVLAAALNESDAVRRPFAV